MNGHTAVKPGRPIWIPEKAWGRLATIAEQRGTTVDDLALEAIGSISNPWDRAEHASTGERVVNMVREGFPDAEIAEELHILLRRVQEIRRRAGLNPNPLGRGGGGTRRST